MGATQGVTMVYSRRPDLALIIRRVITSPPECAVKQVIIGRTIVVQGPLSLATLNERINWEPLRVNVAEEIFISVEDEIDGIVVLSDGLNGDGTYSVALLRNDGDRRL
jgi:hypothetical protein